MKLNIYDAKDTVTGEFLQPFYTNNDATAIRSWSESVKQNEKENNFIGLKDLQLYRLGEFDTETGEIKPKVVYIAKAIDFMKGE